MGAIPTPRSFEQTLSDIIDTYRSEMGVRNLRVAGPLLSMFEAAGRSDARGSQDIFGLLSAISLDRATGLALDREGRGDKIPRGRQSAATGSVTIGDSSLTKIFSKVFPGSPAPIVGSVSIDVTDASNFPNSGQVYLGRGTANYEGPLAYTSKSNVGTHWNLTLSSGTTRFHNTSESVIIAQGGNRSIGAGAIVRTPQANVSSAVEFRTLYSKVLADGEDSLPNVQVVAQLPGIIGNVGASGIKEFASAPFSGATVTNPGPFSNGKDQELDDQYRERIRNARASKQAGTPLAITTAVTGIVAVDENKRINSASLVKRLGQASALYIDDGTGYEDVSAGVPMETIVDFAIGGEQEFQTSQHPIARAFVTSGNTAPFPLIANSTITVSVGGTPYTHTFDPAAFTSISSASAYEIVASINGNPKLGFMARTSGSGSNVVIFAKSDTNEDIQVEIEDSGVDANAILAFPTGQTFTYRLYKNDRLLSKDGVPAVLRGLPVSEWNALTGSQTLSVAVDNTPALTFTFIDQDFIDAGTGFPTVGVNSIDAWASVINAKIPGVTAVNENSRIVLTSNAGYTRRASIGVLGGSLVTAHMFAVGAVGGSDRDYITDRNVGQIKLLSPLLPGDKLTLGSVSSRAFIETPEISTVTLSAAGKSWFIVDSAAEIVPIGVTAATTVALSVSGIHDWGHQMSLIASSGTPFANVVAGDWLILWDPALDVSLRGAHRVVSATGTTLVVERRDGTTLRSGHATVALTPTGGNISKVLTTGGNPLPLSSLGSFSQLGATDTCEIFDPNTKLTTPCAPMNKPRMWHTATLLGNGKVLVVGGMKDDTTALNSLEIYDPAGDGWTMSGATLTTGVFNHTATLLTNGKVLIAGGDSGTGAITQFQIYDPAGDTLSAPGALVHPRARHCAVKLPNDNVFIVGGYDGSHTAQNTTEIWSALGLTSSAAASMTRARYGFGMSLVVSPATKVLAAGNHRGATGNTTYEVYNIAGTTWGAETTLPNNITFEEKNLVYLTNGHSVGLHGFDSGTPSSGVGFSYDGTSFVPLGNSAFLNDSSTKWRSTYVEITNLALTVENVIVCVGGSVQLSTAWGFQPTAQVEQFDEGGLSWTLPDPAATGSVALSSAGLVVVRSDGVVQEIDVPAGTNYTSSTFASVLNDDTTNPGLAGVVLTTGLRGATAATYRTTKVRVSTNRFDKSGSIALVAQDSNAAAFGMGPSDSVNNLVGHIGSVESGSELGTPDFTESHVVGVSKGKPEQVVVDVPSTSLGNALVGLKDWMRGADGTSLYDGSAYRYPRSGTNEGSVTRFSSSLESNSLVRLQPRLDATNLYKPFSRAYLAAPFALTPSDDLTVVVDQDIEKRYAVKMGRKLQTVGSTYAGTNTFKDADGLGQSIAKTFGLSFDFNDFAVFMPSRAVAFSADATRSMLFRYYRLGPEGDVANVIFGNPTLPNTSLSVSVNSVAGVTNVIFKLQSGALRVFPNIHPTTTKLSIGQISVSGGIETRIFVANLKISTASRTANIVHATTALPAGVTNHGLQIGDKVWVNSTDINFSSGLKTITARTNTTFDYAETAANIGATANIGTVSRDTAAEANFTGGSMVVGDFYDTDGNGKTYQVSAVDVSGGWFEATSGNQGTYTSSSPGELLTADFYHSMFAGSSQTATAIVAAINALAGAADSKCPVTAIVLGSGGGTITQSTADTLGSSTAAYQLADGINWVQTTTAPGSPSGDYQLTFKKPITGSLATGSDWVDETVYVVPTTTKNVVDWLNAPTVSGLFTVCSIQASDDGRRVQIASKTPGSEAGVQVQGGLANSVTAAVVGSSFSDGNSKDVSIIPALDASGMSANQWARIDNESGVPMSGFFNAISLSSWSAGGLLTFGSPIVFGTSVQTKVQIEVQGKYIAISDMGMGAGYGVSFSQSSHIRISPAGSPTVGMDQVSEANQGIFRVLRAHNNNQASSGTVWIENSLAIGERVECTVTIFTSVTPVVGDQLLVSDPAWGTANQGLWTISAVGETSPGSGDQYAHSDRLTVDVSSRTPVPQGAAAPLTATQAGLIVPVEGRPSSFIKRIHGIYPNQDDGRFANVRWEDFVAYSAIAESAGSVVTILDKLDFPTSISPGLDAYRYNTGLIGEANKVIYGDRDDSDTYPSVASDGSQIDISGPTIKRVQVVMILRVRSIGIQNDDVGARVRSAVATLINQSPIGQPIALSKIVEVASKVVGVVSVRIISPKYDASDDLIPVQPYEKALVLDLVSDIQISYSGE
jgi:hypothetical protein